MSKDLPKMDDGMRQAEDVSFEQRRENISTPELQAMFTKGFVRMRGEMGTLSEEEAIKKASPSLERVFDQVKEARQGREMPSGEEKKRFSAWLIQSVGQAGADLSPEVRKVLFEAFLKRTPAERILAVLGMENDLQEEKTQTPESRVMRTLEEMSSLESLERSFLQTEERIAWDGVFDDWKGTVNSIDASSEDMSSQVADCIDAQMNVLQGDERISEAVGRDQGAAIEAFVLKVHLLSASSPLPIREELLFRVFSRLPEEAAFPLIKKHAFSFSLETRRKFLRRMVARMENPLEVVQDNPAFVEGISTQELIEDIGSYSPEKAIPLILGLPHDEALHMAQTLAIAEPAFVFTLPPNLQTKEDKKAVALAVLEQKPAEFLRMASALKEDGGEIAEKREAFLTYLVRDKDWKEFSMDSAPFLRLHELSPITEEESAKIAELAIRTHLLNFEQFFKDHLDKSIQEQIKQLPEARRSSLVEVALQATSNPDPLLVARVSRYFLLSQTSLEELRQRYPDLAKTNYVNPEFGGVLGGLALREYQDQPRETQEEMGPDAEQILSRTDQIGTQLTALMKRLVPDRAAQENQRLTQEEALRRPIRYEADLGIGVASSLVVVYEDNYEPAIYKPRTREAKEDAFTHQPIRAGIHPGESAVREWLAVQIDKVFQLDVVPPTILRTGSHGLGSVQKWEKGKMPGDPKAEAAMTPSNLMRIALFDVITQNSDRHSGNFLVAEDGSMRGIDHGYILSRTSMGMDGLRSFPLEKVQGMPIPKELRAHIRLFKESPELQTGLRSAFELAFPGDEPAGVDRLWNEFMHRLDLIDPDDATQDGIFPAPAYH